MSNRMRLNKHDRSAGIRACNTFAEREHRFVTEVSVSVSLKRIRA